ncbi:hypothetical protein [Bradyrhizobium liaoningense]|uniref:hypothetical protein n=1 Tax=Bradyrhizobium liaoningense TaxID=43992 RepID=UPI001BA84EB9|nr:hypothetical protein [Bradyrhizobium liaoningense]MBR0709902.1 hypothetical protein [Bradyrhizobium liaoningense]
MNAKSFAKLVGMVAISVLVATLLLGGSKDANTFGFVGLLVATFWGIPAIVVITLYRNVERRDHDR